MTRFGDILRNLDWSYPLEILKSALPALVCVVLHELAHGFTAYKLGDETAKRSGRLSLNPLKHIDPFGLLLLAVAGFGWAKPVPVNMYNFKRPKRDMTITALAGPVMNFVIAFVCMFLFGLLWQSLWINSFGRLILYFLYRTALLSTNLAIFNLIPIPPLDGSKVMFSVLSTLQYFKLMHYERYGMLLCVIVVLSGVFNEFLNTVVGFVFDRLTVLPMPSYLQLLYILMG